MKADERLADFRYEATNNDPIQGLNLGVFSSNEAIGRSGVLLPLWNGNQSGRGPIDAAQERSGLRVATTTQRDDGTTRWCQGWATA